MYAYCIRHTQSLIGARAQCGWHAQEHNDVRKHIGTERVYRYSYARVPWAFGLKVIVIQITEQQVAALALRSLAPPEPRPT
jgi:hypothetical protein